MNTFLNCTHLYKNKARKDFPQHKCGHLSQRPLTGFEKKKCLKGMPYIFRVHFI